MFGEYNNKNKVIGDVGNRRNTDYKAKQRK